MDKNKILRLAQTLPLNAAEADAYLVTSDVNRFYLTGFRSSAGMVFITREGSYFITDFRYYEAAMKQVDDCRVLMYERLSDMLNTLSVRHHVQKIMVEQEDVSLARWESLKAMLPQVEIISDPLLDRKLKEMRAIKSPEEMENLREAQAITEAAYEYILPRMAPGRSEAEIALELEIYMRRHGAEAVAFDLIVVSGQKSSMPHGVPGNKLLEIGDFVTMDTGAVFEGMHSDMTRTVAIGRVDEEQKHVYEVVLEAQRAAIAAVRDGVSCAAVDEAARSVIDAAGYGKYFGHSTGHSVGYEIHETPSFSPSSKDTAHAGMVITVEPGIYLPGRFGVRIEDMVLVTADGCEDLTHAAKELTVLS